MNFHWPDVFGLTVRISATTWSMKSRDRERRLAQTLKSTYGYPPRHGSRIGWRKGLICAREGRDEIFVRLSLWGVPGTHYRPTTLMLPILLLRFPSTRSEHVLARCWGSRRLRRSKGRRISLSLVDLARGVVRWGRLVGHPEPMDQTREIILIFSGFQDCHARIPWDRQDRMNESGWWMDI